MGGESEEGESGSEGVEGSDEEEDEDEEGASGEEDFTPKKKKQGPDVGAKRKRGADKKGPRRTKPKMEIEYEIAAPEREAVLA